MSELLPVASPPSFSPVVIAGMHRSGTSFLTSILRASGLDVGERLLTPDANNPRGYFEDRRFYDLHLEMLHACTIEEAGFRDWGWTESEHFDRSRLASFVAPALALVNERRKAGRRWGWKDPRTSLLLDFWDDVLARAGVQPGYLLVYRSPWDVASAMTRIHVEVFLERPEYAARIWSFYNRPLLEFHRRNRHRSVLVAVPSLITAPASFTALMAARLGIDVPMDLPSELYGQEGLLTRDSTDPLVRLLGGTAPEAMRIFAELEDCADLPTEGAWRKPQALRTVRTSPRTNPEPDLMVMLAARDPGDHLVEAAASAERNLPRSLSSELAIVDAGSGDRRTRAVLEALRTIGYPILEAAAQESNGPLAAMLAASRAPYLLPLDGADRLREGFVEEALEWFAKDAEIALVYGDRQEFGGSTRLVRAPDFDLDRLLEENYLGFSVLLRRAAVEECVESRVQDELEITSLGLHLVERGWRLQRAAVAAVDRQVSGSFRAERPSLEQVAGRLERLAQDHPKLYRERFATLLLERANQDTGPHPAGGGPGEAATPVEPPSEASEPLRRELDAWQARVRFMEGTRAWKLRERLVRLRGWLR